MKKFVTKIILFFIPLLLLVVSGLVLPATPRARTSLLFAEIQKNQRMQNLESPRIIFVGGSNLSFGLDSAKIENELELNPINTAIDASLGLQYMLENAAQFVKPGDIVVVVPEYNQYYRDYHAASPELLRIVFDVNYSAIHRLSFRQTINLAPFIARYSLSKFKPSEYKNIEAKGIYNVDAFNKYGDTDAHWGKGKQDYAPNKQLRGPLNRDVLENLLRFEMMLKERKASLFISYPGYDEESFDNSASEIAYVHSALQESGFEILGDPLRYRMPNQMMYNSPYHLNKDGVDTRTILLIEDIRSKISVAN